MLKYTTYQSIYNNSSQSQSSVHESAGTVWTRRLQSASFGPFIIKLLLSIFIIVIGCTGVVRVFAGSPDNVHLEKNVIVEQGDTLWGIASAHKPDNMDIRAYIMAIKKNNHINGSEIQAGEVLALPEY